MLPKSRDFGIEDSKLLPLCVPQPCPCVCHALCVLGLQILPSDARSRNSRDAAAAAQGCERGKRGAVWLQRQAAALDLDLGSAREQGGAHAPTETRSSRSEMCERRRSSSAETCRRRALRQCSSCRVIIACIPSRMCVRAVFAGRPSGGIDALRVPGKLGQGFRKQTAQIREGRPIQRNSRKRAPDQRRAQRSRSEASVMPRPPTCLHARARRPH